MSGWTPDELRKISHAEELAIAARSPDGTFSRYVTIWVVRAEDDIYVRSAYGSDNPWYRRAMASGEGRIRAGGVEKDVTFGKAADNGQPAGLRVQLMPRVRLTPGCGLCLGGLAVRGAGLLG
jgi:hypothetical protein